MEGASEKQTEKRDTQPRLERSLGLPHGVGIVIGLMIGGGIFISPGGVLKETESVGLALFVWTLCGLVALLGGLCYAELGTSIAESGASYAYVAYIFGDFPAFMIVWIVLLMFGPVVSAIKAMAFAQYVMKPLFLTCDSPASIDGLIAAIAILLVCAMNCLSVRLASRVQNFFTVTKVAAIAMVIVIGLINLWQGNTKHLENAFDNMPSNPGRVAVGIYSAMFSYSGWDGLNYVTEEIRNPRRNLPLSLVLSIPLVTAIYVLANIAYLTVLSPYQIIESKAVAVSFFDQGVASGWGWIISVLVAFSCFGSLNGSVMTVPRMLMVGARNGHLPEFLSMINTKCLTPVPSVITLCIIACLQLLAGDVYKMMTYMGFVEATILALPIVGLLYLRWTKPDMHRPIKVPLVIPILYCIIAAFILIFPWISSPLETSIGFSVMLSAIPAYIIGVKWKRRPETLTKYIVSITRGLQKLFYCVRGEDDKLE